MSMIRIHRPILPRNIRRGVGSWAQIKTWRTQLQPIVVDSVEDLVTVEVAVVVETAVAVEDVVAAVVVDADVEARKIRNGCP